MEQSKLFTASENLLVAIAYGDSVGLPVETKKWAQIREKYGKISGLQPIDNPFYGSDEAGNWSDDTELSLAVADALIQEGEFSMDAMVEHHIRAMDTTPQRQWKGRVIPRGWGKSTWESVERLKLGESTYRTSGNSGGEGNGVLMKLAPLALWQAATKPREADQQIEDLALMTHANDVSVVTALVHRDVLSLLLGGRIKPIDTIMAAHSLATQYESQYKKAGHKTSQLLGGLASKLILSVENIMELAPGGGFHSPESLVMAYAAFTNYPEFPAGTYEAVNYGGDTDSIGSIVAAMSVMHSGAVEQPHDLFKIKGLDRLTRTGHDLGNLVMGSST